MSVKYENIYFNSIRSKVEIGGGKMLITPSEGKPVTINRGDIDYCEWAQFTASNYCLHIQAGEKFYSLSMFSESDRSGLFHAMQTELDAEPIPESFSVSGLNEGVFNHNEHAFWINEDGKPIFKVPYKTITNTQPAKNDFLVTIAHEGKSSGIQLESVCIFVPQNGKEKVTDIVANIRNNMKSFTAADNYFAQINSLTLKQPPGTADFRYCDDFLFIQYDQLHFQVKYNNIRMIHRLQVPESKNEYVVITLSHPIKKGRQEYNDIVVETDEKEIPKILNIPDSTMKASDAICKLFDQYAAKKEVEHEGFFHAADGSNAVIGSFKTTSSTLFMTNKHFIILPKARIIPYSSVSSVEFKKIDKDTMRNTKCFDLGISEEGGKPIEFINIPHKDFGAMLDFFKHAGLTIKSIDLAEEFQETLLLASGDGRASRAATMRKIREEQEAMKKLGSTDSDEEEDEDFNPDKKPSSDDGEDEEEEVGEKSDDEPQAPVEEPKEDE